MGACTSTAQWHLHEYSPNPAREFISSEVTHSVIWPALEVIYGPNTKLQAVLNARDKVKNSHKDAF